MTVKEMKAYLGKYPDGEEVRFIAANIKNRIAYPNYQISLKCITDTSAPVLCLELGESEPFDEEMIQAAEEDERNSMWIPVSEKFPEPCKWVMATVKSHRWISDYGEPAIPEDEKVDHPERIFTAPARYGKEGLWQWFDVGEEAINLANYADMEDLSGPREDVIAWMALPEPYKEESE